MSHPMTPKQVELVQGSWREVLPIADTAAELFYDTVAAALVWTLGQGLGEQFTPELRDAWVAAYGVLAKTMKDAAATVAA